MESSYKASNHPEDGAETRNTVEVPGWVHGNTMEFDL